ncbi:hypothetical protein ABBQ38_013266 [Trebouxia sp. C0009 RCD-2024]
MSSCMFRSSVWQSRVAPSRSEGVLPSLMIVYYNQGRQPNIDLPLPLRTSPTCLFKSDEQCSAITFTCARWSFQITALMISGNTNASWCHLI